MPLADEIQALATRTLVALAERHDYYTFTKRYGDSYNELSAKAEGSHFITARRARG